LKYIIQRESEKKGREGEIVSYVVCVPVTIGDTTKKCCKTFRISDYSSRQEALKKAKEYRDETMKRREQIRKEQKFELYHKYTVKELYQLVPSHFRRRKQTYIGMNKVYFKYIDPKFGSSYIEDVTMSDILDTLCVCAETCSQHHVNKLKSIWHRIYQEASIQNLSVKDWTLVMDTPVSDVVTERSISEQNITEGDFQMFCEKMAEYGHYMPYETVHIYRRTILLYLIRLLRITGMRPQEGKALRRCDIAFEEIDWSDPDDPDGEIQKLPIAKIRIGHSIGSTLSELNVLRDTKTPQSKRVLYVADEGRKILEEVMAYSRHDLLFSDYDGNPFTPSFLSQYFYRVSRYAGVKVYPLLMRKSFSADMYANSVNPAVIRSLMGHKSEDMSLNAYATAALSDVITASLKRKYKK